MSSAQTPGDIKLEVAAFAELLRDAEEHHGAYEASAPPHHWSGWYAAYILARRQGRSPEEASSDAGQYMEGELARQEGSP